MNTMTPRRLAAAHRAIKRQQEKYSLFTWAGTAVQEGLVDPSPEERICRIDSATDAMFRRFRVLSIGVYREAFNLIKPECRPKVKQTFRDTMLPKDAYYFCDFARKRCGKCQTNTAPGALLQASRNTRVALSVITYLSGNTWIMKSWVSQNSHPREHITWPTLRTATTRWWDEAPRWRFKLFITLSSLPAGSTNLQTGLRPEK